MIIIISFNFCNLLTAPRTVSNHPQSCANDVQHIERLSRASVMLRTTWYEETAQLLSLTELKSHLFELYFIGWTIKPMKEGRKPEYPEKTPSDELLKKPQTKSRRFKPQARTRTRAVALVADVLTVTPRVAPRLYFTLLYFTLLYFTLLYFTLLCFALLCFAYFALLCFTLLCFTLLYFTLLYFTFLSFPFLSCTLPSRWPSGKASASRAEDRGFESRLRRDFFGVESYQWLQNWHSSGYPARRLAL